MMLSVQFKEAVKTALAMVITYWIALSASWMNPHWAALTVALISLPTAGESIQKGLQRLSGTIPACLVALLIIMIAVQDRWLFVALACAWIFLTTYIKLIDRKRDHFWQIAGFVCLVILSGSTTSTAYFNVAIYRTLETGMGVAVYSLVALFIWPQHTEDKEANQPPSPKAKDTMTTLPWYAVLLDRDRFTKSLFAAFCPLAGFLLWIYFDPAGHVGWFVICGSLGMLVATMPQLRASMLVVPLGVFLGIALLLYVFVLPRLDNFIQLGTLIFLLIFLNSYFLKGVPRILGAMAIVMELSIRNVQVYNFPAMANTYIFILMAFLFIYALSYLLGSSRPEKQVLHYLNRFFSSAHYLSISHNASSGLFSNIRRVYCIQELRGIPQKLAPWVKSIPANICPDNTDDKTMPMITSLKSISEELCGLLNNPQAIESQEVSELLVSAESCFEAWQKSPELDLEILDGESSSNHAFQPLLDAVNAYAKSAKALNWNQWREERFS